MEEITTMRRRFPTFEDAIAQELRTTVEAWCGDDADDVDLEALAEDVLAWVGDDEGGVVVTASAAEFWGAVVRHTHVPGPEVPVPSWARTDASRRWVRDGDGTICRHHEWFLGKGVTLSQRVTASDTDEVEVGPIEVLVDLPDGPLTIGYARGLGKMLRTAAEVAESIERGE